MSDKIVYNQDWSTKDQRELQEIVTVYRHNFRETEHDCCAICKHKDCAELYSLTHGLDGASFICDGFGR